MVDFLTQMQTVHDTTGAQFPVLVGLMAANALEPLCEVPAFQDSTDHSAIASNILSSPVKEWQRPKIAGKVDEIAERYGQPGELMPNPVLLAAKDGSLTTRVVYTHSDGTQVLEASITSPTDGSRPLLILDGQHRVEGMSQSAVPNNPLPFVILANQGTPVYSESTYAQIFAEVTTKSTQLEQLHDEWLKFAFRLDTYDMRGRTTDTPAVQAMKTVVHLCSWSPQVPKVNVFRNKIQFNPKKQAAAAIGGGFAFDATNLRKIVEKGYFANSTRATNLVPTDVAESLSEALIALSQVITTPLSRSVFFGDPGYKQLPAQYGLMHGLLEYLAVHGVPSAGWQLVFKDLKFDTSNWDFKSWVNQLDGNVGNRSRDVAALIFREFFAAGSLPRGVRDIPSYLRGDDARLLFEVREVGPGGRMRRSGTPHELVVGRLGYIADLSDTTKLLYKGCTSSIARVELRDRSAPFSNHYSVANVKRGAATPRPQGDSAELGAEVEFYGGVTQEFRIDLSWT